MPAQPVRWGIIGPGNIANTFAEGLALAPGSRLVAVASRSPDKAAAFAGRHGGRGCRAAELCAAADVDVVYIATPHPQHHAAARLALEAGKAVLVEKPITMNAAQLEDLIALAAARRVFLMEAMWSRFLPAARQVRAWLDAGAIGEPRMVSADFGSAAAGTRPRACSTPRLAAGRCLMSASMSWLSQTWSSGPTPSASPASPTSARAGSTSRPPWSSAGAAAASPR